MSKELNLDDLEQVQGGYRGADKYSEYEYSEAGITFNHYKHKKDEYFINVGNTRVSISQADAERLVEAWRGKNPYNKKKDYN